MTAAAKGAKILVLDDDESLRELVQFQLEDSGCVVDLASSADEGLAKLRANQYDLIVSDIRMPGEMDGIEMVQNYRQENPDLKVLFMTGFEVEERINLALREPHTLLIKKPFFIDDLQAKVDELLAS